MLNKIKFQPNLNLQNFLSLFGSKDQYGTALVRWLWQHGFVCPSCDHTKIFQLNTKDLFQCNCCRAQITITTKSISSSTQFSFSTCFFSIYRERQSKINISALSLKCKVTDLYNKALLISHTYSRLCQECKNCTSIDVAITR